MGGIIMANKSKCLINLIDDYFYDIVDDDLIKLKESDSYKRMQEEMDELFEDFPTLEKFIVDEKNVCFTIEDTKGLRQFLGICNSINTLELQCCYYKGMRDYIDFMNTIKYERR